MLRLYQITWNHIKKKTPPPPPPQADLYIYFLYYVSMSYNVSTHLNNNFPYRVFPSQPSPLGLQLVPKKLSLSEVLAGMLLPSKMRQKKEEKMPLDGKLLWWYYFVKFVWLDTSLSPGQSCPQPASPPNGNWTCLQQELPIPGASSLLDGNITSYQGVFKSWSRQGPSLKAYLVCILSHWWKDKD